MNSMDTLGRLVDTMGLGKVFKHSKNTFVKHRMRCLRSQSLQRPEAWLAGSCGHPATIIKYHATFI